MLGEEFRKLRQKEKISMTEACKGITSQSSLQRWETGNGLMPIEKVMSLLARIHVQPEEFLEKFSNDNLSDYTQAISHAYITNDVKAMKKITLFFLKLSEKERKQKLFFKAAIACNYYMDMTNINLLPKKDVPYFEKYFLPIKNWQQEDMTLFGNMQLILPAKTVYSVSRSLFSYLVDSQKSGLSYIMSINTLINAIFVLLKKQNINQARHLFSRLKQLNISEKYSNELIRINYINTVFSYLDTGSIVSMDDFLDNLETLGFKEKANDFRIGFSQFQKLRKMNRT